MCCKKHIITCYLSKDDTCTMFKKYAQVLCNKRIIILCTWSSTFVLNCYSYIDKGYNCDKLWHWFAKLFPFDCFKTILCLRLSVSSKSLLMKFNPTFLLAISKLNSDRSTDVYFNSSQFFFCCFFFRM